MTTLELNQEIYSSLAELSKDENNLKKVSAYLKRLLQKEREKNEKAISAREETLQAIADAKCGKDVTHCDSFEEYLNAVSE